MNLAVGKFAAQSVHVVQVICCFLFYAMFCVSLLCSHLVQYLLQPYSSPDCSQIKSLQNQTAFYQGYSNQDILNQDTLNQDSGLTLSQALLH